MMQISSVLSWSSALLLSSLLLSGCTYEAALQRLSLTEQSQFYTYNKMMTDSQKRVYLAKDTAAERTAYLSEIGLAQRLQALDPVDRDTVYGGSPRPGMSADALRLLWGDPHYTEGDARRSAHWHYLGPSFAMGVRGNQYTMANNRVDVYLTDGKVVGWVDTVPSDHGDGGDGPRR